MEADQYSVALAKSGATTDDGLRGRKGFDPFQTAPSLAAGLNEKGFRGMQKRAHSSFLDIAPARCQNTYGLSFHFT